MKEKSLLANELVRQRKKHNLTQTAVAKIVGVSTGSVAHWENDRRKPSEEKLDFLTEIYGLKKGYFDHFLKEETKEETFKKGDIVQSNDTRIIVKVISDIYTDDYFNGVVIESNDEKFKISECCNGFVKDAFKKIEYTEKITIFKKGDVVITNTDIYAYTTILKIEVLEDCLLGDVWFKGKVLETSEDYYYPVGEEEDFKADVFKIYEEKRKVIQKDVFYTLKKGSGYISNLLTASDGETTLNIRNAIHCFYPSKRYKTLAETYDAKIVKIVQTFEEVE